MDRYAECRQIAVRVGVDAVALVPGPNFVTVLGKAFGSNERPLVVVVPVDGPPAASSEWDRRNELGHTDVSDGDEAEREASAPKNENMFARLKDWRRIAPRYDRCLIRFLSACALAATFKYWF